MWEEDRARLLTLHPETWAGMLSNNELAIGYVVLIRLLLGVLSSPLTYNRSEQKLYNCVMTYAAQFKDDQTQKDEVLTLLLPCIRFNFIPIDFLVNTYVLTCLFE